MPAPVVPPQQPGWIGQPVSGGGVAVAPPNSDEPGAFAVPTAPPAVASWAALMIWITENFAGPRFDAEVFRLMLVCGWRSALGGFLGAIVGSWAAMLMASIAHPGAAFARTTMLLGLLSAGIVMGFLHGRDAIIGRPTFTVSRWFFVVSFSAVAAAVAAIAIAAVTFGAPDNYGSPLPLNFGNLSGVLAWAMLALGVVMTIGRAVPNVTLGMLIFSGFLAAGLSFVAMKACPNDMTGLLSGAVMLGLATSVLVTLAEAASREWYLEYPGGHGRVARLNLGVVPVLVGANPAVCHVVKAGGSIPVSLKYWVDTGQPFVVDCAGTQTFRVSAGERRTLAGTVLSVKSFVAHGTRSAVATDLSSSGATPQSTGGAGGSRPVLTRPATFGAPVTAAPVAPVARASSLPPPPPPPPPRT